MRKRNAAGDTTGNQHLQVKPKKPLFPASAGTRGLHILRLNKLFFTNQTASSTTTSCFNKLNNYLHPSSLIGRLIALLSW